MKDFNSLSGPWIGFSVQDGLRISERMSLLIMHGDVSGKGSDKDGSFDVNGRYFAEGNRLFLIRTYTWTTEPSQAGVGIPYEYHGTWDGDLAFGSWHPAGMPSYGGAFEMWPDLGEEFNLHVSESEMKEPLAIG